MSFPPLFSSVQLAMRPAAIAALALNPGQVLTGRVTGRLQNGATLLQAGTHQLALQMQSPPAVGTLLSLRVEGRGAEMRLMLVPTGKVDTPAAPPAVTRAGGGQPHPQPGTTASPTPAPTSTPAPAATPPQDGAAKAALAQMVQGAIGRQASLGPVLQTVQALGPALRQMPEPVQRLATQLLAKSLKLDERPVDAAALQKAVRQSGIFQEALLAGGMRAGTTQGDTKAELQVLARALRNWVGTEPVAGVRAPNVSGAAQQAAPPVAGSVREGATFLLARTEAALSQMTQGPVARQAGTALLLQTVQNLGPILAQMPEPVRRIAAQMLERGLKLDGAPAGGNSLRPAGTLPETLLSNPARAGAPQDAEADLRTLARTLRSWLDGEPSPVAPVRPAPPEKGAPPRVPMRGAAPPPPETVREGAKLLLEQVDDALARVRLLQSASLPDEATRHQAAEWNLDLPIILNGQPNVLPFQIQRDDGDGSEAAERGWRVRFAIDLGEKGEAGAQISLRAGRVSAMLWAAETETAAIMEAGLGWLSAALAEAGLTTGTLVCRHGVPEAPAARTPGGLVDSTL